MNRNPNLSGYFNQDLVDTVKRATEELKTVNEALEAAKDARDEAEISNLEGELETCYNLVTVYNDELRARL